ncbi:endonuclease domain-containing protein [Membranicola marinus]|uniref:Endonuclease domain-containing protein n=1 Tax=Membranihabitans marinus TaxID=1227546 RepID=A0A953HK68_9BACT|nr:endonuclease domain-containing protein [Membranihabitans marinus]MBY5957202.1 endonuclease domain-containing protein [Membranihabitans marinus]
MSYKTVLELARWMRTHPTPAEQIFWSKVRNKKFYGLKFYRQYIIEHSNILGSKSFFIPDFYCHQGKTIIEIDGDIHHYQMEYDQLREERLIEMEYSILRFENDLVLNNWNAVESELKRKLLL